MNICANCKHILRNVDSGTFFDARCKANPYEVGVDPVTGQEGPFERDENMRFIPQQNQFKPCRDMNWNGNCEEFEAKEGS